MNITDVNRSVSKHKAAKRRGRGKGSGLGKTAGRGQKGLGSRAGANYLRGFIGGQTKLMNRLPKRGFNNAVFKTLYAVVNLGALEERFKANDEVNPDTLKATGGVTLRRGEKIKILGSGDLSKPLTVKAHAFSKSAREKIEKAGGTVEVIQ